MLLDDLQKQGLITPPKWLVPNTVYLCIMGSAAYGSANISSDTDVYGFAVPPKEDIFPHLTGEIPDFGTAKPRFNVWDENHIKSLDGKDEYDFNVYSIVRFFNLALNGSPNIIDAIYVPRRCIIHATNVSELMRSKRKIFLNKMVFTRFRGYAFRQMAEIRTKKTSNPKRAATIEQFGYDTKFASHVVRLALQAEQILTQYDLDLEANRIILQSIRRGEWTFDEFEHWFTEKEKMLEILHIGSHIPDAPDEEVIKLLLLNCLEHHYGSLDAVIRKPVQQDKMMREIEAVLAKYR